MADDAALMAALAAGADGALDAVARRLAGPLRASATRIVGGAAADDVVQETLERVWRHASRFDAERGTLEAWALRIGRNVAIGYLRRERSRAFRAADSGAAIDLDRVADPVAGPADVAERAALAGAVRRAVHRLRPERRAALECVLAGHTLVAAADLLGLPEGTLKSRVRAAYADLRPDPTLIALVS
jgi:RNA polymerase sigma-70 factor (ECF subfamily)